MKGNSWFSVSKIDSPWANLILRKQIYLANFYSQLICSLWANFVSNFFLWAIFVGCEQFFCRRQQQDNRAGRSNFEPARHGTGNGFASGRRVYSRIHDSTTYCRTFQYKYFLRVLRSAPSQSHARVIFCVPYPNRVKVRACTGTRTRTRNELSLPAGYPRIFFRVRVRVSQIRAVSSQVMSTFSLHYYTILHCSLVHC